MNTTKKFVLVAALAGLIATAAGCSPADDAPAPSADGEVLVGIPGNDMTVDVEAQQALYDALPAAIKDRGTMVIAVESNAGLPNSITTPEGNLVGLTIDTANLIGAAIGIDVDLQTATFDQLIPGIQAGRFDLSTATFADTLERREVVDFVNHMVGVHDMLLMLKTQTEWVDTLTPQTACGLSVSVNKGGVQANELAEASDACVANGDEPIDIQLYSSNPEALLAVKSGRADAGIFGYTQVQQYVSEDDTLAAGLLRPGIIRYTGMATPKGATELQEAVRGAILYLHETGTWLEVLKLYGLEAHAPTEKVINNLEPFDPETANEDVP